MLNSEIKKIKNYLKELSSFGYELFDWFKLPDGIWWDNFYKPLEKKIRYLLKLNPNLKKNKQILKFEEEINMVKSNPKDFDTAFYVMKKI